MSIGKRFRYGVAWLLARLMPRRLMCDRAHFDIWEEAGYHISRVHFYEPIPDTRELPESLWEEREELPPGIDWREDGQVQLLKKFAEKYGPEFAALPQRETATGSDGYFLRNTAFSTVDAELSYAFIRQHKPRRIMEIGSGYSTRLAARAVLKNAAEGHPCELVACEPYPLDWLVAGFPGLNRLERVKVQDIPLERFAALEENDILFIDSSHVLAIGNDVQYEYLEVLPRLKPGVLVHIHDIFLPGEYPRAWVMHSRRFWTEQYLLQAFLSGNRDYEILAGANFLHRRHADKLARFIPSYPAHRTEEGPGSFWMRRKG